MQFRKKPVQIEAIRCREAHRLMGGDWKSLPSWFREAYEGKNAAGVRTVIAIDAPKRCIDICTLEGVMRAGIDDWIIRGVKGELYPCKPDIFAATYEPADPPTSHGRSSVIDEIAAERRRQIEVEGWTTKHDDNHRDGELPLAASAYCRHAALFEATSPDVSLAVYQAAPPPWWPANWSRKWWKPKDPHRDLVRAAALIVAEIERLERAFAKRRA